MMRRTAFKPRTPQQAQRDPDRVRSIPTVTPGAFRVPESVNNAPAAPIEKSAPVRSEAYRRLVATLPCYRSVGVARLPAACYEKNRLQAPRSPAGTA